MIITNEDLAFIDEAVASVADRLNPEDRFDLRQDLAELMLRHEEEPENRRSWLRRCANNWVHRFLDHQRRSLELNAEIAAEAKILKRSKTIWEPKWYPPHRDAIAYPWLACDGARIMHCKKQ